MGRPRKVVEEKKEVQNQEIEKTEVVKPARKPRAKKTDIVEVEDHAIEKDSFLMQLEKFTRSLNVPPNPAKIVKHPDGYEYIPVSVIEKDLAKMFFGLVQYEIVSKEVVHNETTLTTRIKVYHPVLKQWMNYDGTGSSEMSQEEGTSVADFHIFKKRDALKLAQSKAYAEGIKNGAKKIGKKFGSDLNRLFEDNYKGFYKQEKEVGKILNQ